MRCSVGNSVPSFHHLYETERHTLEGLSQDKGRAKFAKTALTSPFDEGISNNNVFQPDPSIWMDWTAHSTGGGGVANGDEGVGWDWFMIKPG
jgi:hypothetical protein